MMQLEQMIRDLERITRLDQQIADLKPECRSLKGAVSDAETEMRRAHADFSAYENSGFFRQLQRNFAEKKEDARRKYRVALADYESLSQDLARKEATLTEMEEEFQSLRPVWTNYFQVREAYLASEGADPDTLQAKEQRLACTAGIISAGRILYALREARMWMQEAALRTRTVSEDNRKLEFLALAEAQAKILAKCASILPEDVFTVGNYLRNPTDFITGVTSKYAQLDKLNLAIAQVDTLRDQMKAFL